MHLALLLSLQTAAASLVSTIPQAAGAQRGGQVFSGRAGQLQVTAPRVEAELKVDGVLDEAVWQDAAVLRDFSQFDPNDGVPASDSTEVLVWYSPTAIHFGIRAFEAHGSVHGTLADRDRIGADDFIEILLGTFNDGRQATMFGVNPLGVQMDGAMVERGTGGGIGNTGPARERADLSPDFTWQSKGQIVPGGYVVEVRIPFKSLRFQPSREQTWTLNVTRQVQHSGFEDSWAPARRASASFLGQSGRLVGLTEIRRGLVVDVNPEVTSTRVGTPTAGVHEYTGGDPQFGGNVRWGITNNLNLNAAFNPDFSQIESDAGQLGFDPRQALFFPERRPFFLDGIEQFSTPNQLIYTRRIVQPVAAVKLTGTTFGSNVALLSAVDDRDVSATGEDNPIYNILRVQKDVGGASRIGVAYTDRIDGDNYNRVADIDGRLVFGRIYSSTFQFAHSWTGANGANTDAPLWLTQFNRNGRRFGWRTLFAGISEDFRAGSGFVGRTGVVRASLTPRLTFYGKPGATIENFTPSITLDGTWQYRKFVDGEGMQDAKLHFDFASQLKGGWNVGVGYFHESFGYDEDLYANYFIATPDGAGGTTFEPFVGQPEIINNEFYVNINTPVFRKFNAFLFFLYGNDENFPEWATGTLVIGNAGLSVRPSDKLRVDLTYNWQQVNRRTDGSEVLAGRIPRAKLEYQISRPFFIRLVGEYAMQRRDSLRDDSRTNLPIYFGDGQGGFTRAERFENNTFRTDVLFAYRPTPGTVIFAGYGSAMTEPESFRFQGLRRTRDSFFAKVSYLFHL